ncbi:MAG: hypothetical protein DRJ67_01590 [Thermoprotei archaeon]|nr:MAG: hypothetical protein DRJ67_01590 [Thermoprotei archaeon]
MVAVVARMKLLNTINELFRGTPLVRDKLEAYSLLHDLAEEVASDRASMEEAEVMLDKVAETIAALLASAGKRVGVEEVSKKLKEAFKAEVNALRMSALRHELARRIAERISRQGF